MLVKERAQQKLNQSVEHHPSCMLVDYLEGKEQESFLEQKEEYKQLEVYQNFFVRWCDMANVNGHA